MNKIWKPLFLAACIVGFICLVVFAIVPYGFHEDKSYSGQEAFQTVQEFEDFKANFKSIVVEDNLGLETFVVVASEPPIIVNFGITAPFDYEFPYGELEKPIWVRNFQWIAVSCMLGVFLCVGVPMIVFTFEEG